MTDTALHSAWITDAGRRGGTAAGPDGDGDGDARLFPYWSFTKTVIAATALRMAEAGAVSLDDPLGDGTFTLGQALGHTAGLADYTALPDYHRDVAAGADAWPRARMLAAVDSLGRPFRPGRGWAYSNLGYMLANEHLARAAGETIGAVVDRLILRPLGLWSVTLPATRRDFARVHWPAARAYDPGWVYHGCLVGTAADAARLLDGILAGPLLTAASRARMRQATPLGGAIGGRPWTAHGYGLGLMTGQMNAAGRATGHSGGGPFSMNAVYRFPDLPDPVTVATFGAGTEVGRAEAEAARIALSL